MSTLITLEEAFQAKMRASKYRQRILADNDIVITPPNHEQFPSPEAINA